MASDREPILATSRDFLVDLAWPVTMVGPMRYPTAEAPDHAEALQEPISA